MADRIREFIYEQFPLAKKASLSDEDTLLESGIVDSLGILELVNFVTEKFGITVSDEDLQPETFNSIGSLAAFVEARRGSGS